MIPSELCSGSLKQETQSPTMSPLASPPSSPPHYQRVPLSHGYSKLRSSTEQMHPGKRRSRASCPRQGLRDALINQAAMPPAAESPGLITSVFGNMALFHFILKQGCFFFYKNKMKYTLVMPYLLFYRLVHL